MIEGKEFYRAVCDTPECGRVYRKWEDKVDSQWWISIGLLERDLWESNWTKKGKKVYCPGCSQQRLLEAEAESDERLKPKQRSENEGKETPKPGLEKP